MKPLETKNQFISLRAEGRSYAYIGEALNISKATCTSWERELEREIAQLKAAQLQELYDSYHMTREGRIKKLGETLNQIEEALDTSSLEGLSPERLLDYKLKYTEALKAEYIDLDTVDPTTTTEPHNIMDALGDLLSRIKQGRVTNEQANRESAVLATILKAYEAAKLKEKIEILEAIIGGRS
jgi:hypothetical protein